MVVPTLLTCILLYAALLRLDALFKSYGPYDHPRWLAAMQPSVRSAASLLTPDWRWQPVAEPYVGSDPINYLKYAREMRNFYQAHVREPMFLVTTRFWLLLTGDADVAISLASIMFSLMLLLATYAVGRHIASSFVGLGAAAALAIDRSAVAWSIEGWRDEMFAFFVVLSAWSALRLARVDSRHSAVLSGVVSAGACLTRITSITFLAPAWLWLVTEHGAAPRGRRLSQVAVSIGVMAILVAPYLVNCAITLGDPLFAINDHTRFYSSRENATDASRRSALRYTLEKFATRPVAAADTAIQGIFVYPFVIKWVGLENWRPGLGIFLSWMAIGGLVLWAWTPAGRLLLVILAGSLAPYMLIWTIRGGGEWRFTLHAYPFYLLAAFWLLHTVIQSVRRGIREGLSLALGRLNPAAVARVSITLVAVLAALSLWKFGMPYAMAREVLLRGETAIIRADERDRWLLFDGWSDLAVTGAVVSRFAIHPSATIRIPVPEVRPYRFVLRIDPLEHPDSPPQRVRVLLNGQPVGNFNLQWNPERIGEYELIPPTRILRKGINELTLLTETMIPMERAGTAFPEIARDQSVGLRFWYIAITPA